MTYSDGLRNPALTNRVMDIEELLGVASAHSTCPYYLSRELHHRADLVFLPYNYVIDTVARRSMQLDLDGAVLLFDEAHNLVNARERHKRTHSHTHLMY